MAAAVMALLLVGVYGHYETTHDIPNPFWGTFTQQFTYTPEQGPPGGGLLVSRPDAIVGRYLADYIRVAGTYPCADDLDDYQDDNDRFLLGHPCGVARPVASFAIASVRVYVYGTTLIREPQAEVRYAVTYADGRTHAYAMILGAWHHDGYWLAFTNQDCWSAIALLDLYPDIVSQVPSGAEYIPLAPNGQLDGTKCQPASAAG